MTTLAAKTTSAMSQAPWCRSSITPPTMVLSVSRPEGAGLQHRQQVGRQVAHQADQQPGRAPAAGCSGCATASGSRSAGRRGSAGATLPQVRQPASPALAGGQAARLRSSVCHIDHSSRAGALVDHEHDEPRHRPEGRPEVDGRHAADLHQRHDDADQEDLGHRPGAQVGGDAEGGGRAARAAAAEAQRHQRIGERAGADQRDDDDEERRRRRERDDEADGEGERRVEQRGVAVQADDRRELRGTGRSAPRSSGSGCRRPRRACGRWRRAGWSSARSGSAGSAAGRPRAPAPPGAEGRRSGRR